MTGGSRAAGPLLCEDCPHPAHEGRCFVKLELRFSDTTTFPTRCPCTHQKEVPDVHRPDVPGGHGGGAAGQPDSVPGGTRRELAALGGQLVEIGEDIQRRISEIRRTMREAGS